MLVSMTMPKTWLLERLLLLDDIKKFAILKNRIGIEGQRSMQTS